MAYDIKNDGWRYDIHSFDLTKGMLERILHREGEFWEKHRTRLRERLHTIQQKYPTHIKVDEIP